MTAELKNFFHTKKWSGGGAETISGKGSTVAFTETMRPKLSALLQELNVKVLLDAPCGDFNWMRHVDMSGIRYIGLDIVNDIIAMNRERYARDDRRFDVADITADPLPACDLMLCRDCLFHLPFEYIWRFFRNFVSSGIPLLLMTNHVTGANNDMATPGGYMSRDFLQPPFNFARPRPEHWIKDNGPDGGNRFLCLWTAEQVADAVRRADAH